MRTMLLLIPVILIFWVPIIYLFILIVRALRKYLNSKPQREKSAAIKQTLGETLKSHRIRCQMTQEFVAESMGVSRQAVSKWENGTSDPSTTNLLKLAQLYSISPEDLLRSVSNPES